MPATDRPATSPAPRHIGLDTDIGSDVDDVLALAAILGSSSLVLDHVTTVYGDTLVRARLAAHALRLAGRQDSRVVPGTELPRSGRAVWWAGHEGQLVPELDSEAVDRESDAVNLLAGTPTVLAIGPLTNVAAALEQPACSIEQLYLMGGEFSRHVPEHNISCDSTAAASVFAAGVPVTAIGIDQTARVRVGTAFVAAFEAAGRLGAFLAAEIRQYWAFGGTDSNVPHDPLAVLMLTDPQLFTFERGGVTVTAEGVTEFAAAADGPHRVVVDLDVPAVTDLLVARILAAAR